MSRSQSGFTLIEMAIVVVVVSLLLGRFLVPLAAEMDYQRIQWTQQQLEEIKKALVGFFVIYKRLPCPADSSGIEQISLYPPKDPITNNPMTIPNINRSCMNGQGGFLPWLTLGVGRYDAWGKPFHYHVAEQFTNSKKQVVQFFATDPDFATDPIKGTQYLREPTMFSDQSSLEVMDAVYLTQLTNQNDTHVAVIILSYGKNGEGDGENGNSDARYQIDTKLKSFFPGKDILPGGDDILTWMSVNTLAYYLITTKGWPIQLDSGQYVIQN